MGTVLAALRDDLDFQPSPVPDRPGLMVRDPLRYSDVALILPLPLVRCLTCFDGAHSVADLHAVVLQETGRLDLVDAADELVRALSDAGFLDDEAFRRLRAARRDAFARAPLRTAAFAGDGYPHDRVKLAQTIETWMRAPPPPAMGAAMELPPAPGPSLPILAIAAPHVSPIGGVASYGAAYRALGPELADRTFVILGTSHYGQPNRFGLTRKPFQTPLGQAVTDVALVDWLERAAPDAVDVEDYCQAVEHSIEFQVLFLQALFGPSVKILPILCGPFWGPVSGHIPEDDPGVARVLDSLGRLRTATDAELVWVLGVDMAHVGRRYGDDWDARPHDGRMDEVAARDRARLERVVAGDAGGFWKVVHERGHDDLKWCGTSPLYAFLHAHPRARGRILHYDQWTIDEKSIVSFAAVAFSG